MRYQLSNLPLNLGEEGLDLALPLARTLGGRPADYRDVILERRSLDARHKGTIRFLATLSFESDGPLESRLLPGGVKLEPAPPVAPYVVSPAPRKPRVVIVGSGPAGTFCALRLLDYGIEPVVLERGPAMGERVKAIAGLWKDAVLDPEANAQFGEGGAGTFSDGKLTTRIGHPATRYVLDTFVRFGANPRILYLAKPHVGTDVIRRCAVLIRKEAEARGARYRFKARLEEVR
ncbi:MAG: FAD-dependent monooxygenase, partial [Acidobacteriota bacterium]|nr:FAD-dependent monooxygenase [Acidobacteriota bacterium]